MSRWSEDRLGLALVVVPFAGSLVQAVGLALRSDAGLIAFWGGLLLNLFVTYVLAGIDASRRGQTASILLLMVWGIGYPLHMRSRQRYPGNYFGLGSAVVVLICWLAFILLASRLRSVMGLGTHAGG